VTTNLLAQYGFLTTSSSGATQLVAAVAGFRIIVSQVCVITSAPNSVQFSGTVAGNISALFPLAANGGFVMPYSELGWMQTNIGDALIFNMSAGAQTGVQVVYALSSN
jgi:hypothetical protein